MAVSQRSDQVFQLSLTEIAFTIAFLLLLLLGYLVMRESTARQRAEAELAQVQKLETAEKAAAAALEELKSGLEGAGVRNPDEIISKLVAEAQVAAERDRLLVKVQDLEAQISALAEVKQMLAGATKQAGETDLVERVVTALAVQAEAERALEAADKAMQTAGSQPAASAPAGTTSEPTTPSEASAPQTAQPVAERPAPRRESTREEVRRSIEVASAVDRALRQIGAAPLPSGNETEVVAALVRAGESVRGLDSAGKGVDAVLKENADLRGQMANIRTRLSGMGRGLDHPPCWADETGRIEYLFNVELKPGSVTVTPAWPARRGADAARLPGVEELLTSPLTYEKFRTSARPIFELSKRQDPECRHFVIIKNSIDGRREADQARWMVEEFFYKLEARR